MREMRDRGRRTSEQTRDRDIASKRRRSLWPSGLVPLVHQWRGHPHPQPTGQEVTLPRVPLAHLAWSLPLSLPPPLSPHHPHPHPLYPLHPSLPLQNVSPQPRPRQHQRRALRVLRTRARRPVCAPDCGCVGGPWSEGGECGRVCEGPGRKTKWC